MRLRSPAEFYIKYLLLHPTGHSDEEVKQLLIEKELDWVSGEYIARVRKTLKPPMHFFPRDSAHGPSFFYLCQEGVNRMFFPDPDTKQALSFLKMPRVKEFLESMIISGAPEIPLASHVSKLAHFNCTVSAVQQYKHYFWNIDLVSSTQMRMLVQLRFEDAADQPEFKNHKSILKGAYYKDPKKIAAELPQSASAALMAQMRMGASVPKSLDLGAHIKHARNIAVLKAEEAGHQDGQMDSQRMLNFANAARLLTEMEELVTNPDSELREELQAIPLQNDLRPLPLLTQLSAGQYTAELAPLKDPKHEQPEPDRHAGSGKKDRGG